LDTDACDVSIIAVLSQVQGGEERVIAYSSRSLSKQERNYCVIRKELLAVVYYTRAFRQYLLGRQFLIRTDHSALQWLRSMPDPMGQQARWCEILEEFNFQIIHRPGRNHGNAGTLSRRPCRQCGNDTNQGENARIWTIDFGVIPENTRWSKNEIAEAIKTDPEIAQFTRWITEKRLPIDSNELASCDPVSKCLHAQWESFVIRDGVLHRRR